MQVTIYTASWCRKCRDLKSVYADCQEVFKGYHWKTVDVDDDPDAPARAVPSVLIERQGNRDIVLVGFAEINESLELVL